MQRFLAVLWLIAITISSIAFLWSMFHNFMDVSMSLLIVNTVLSLVCWRVAVRRARRRQAWQAYLHRYHWEEISMATLNEVKTLARQLGITFTDHDQAFDLDSQANAPLQFGATFRKVQAGIDGAYDSLLRYQANLNTLPSR